MTKSEVLSTIDQILLDLKAKFGSDGRAYIQEILLDMYTSDTKKSNTVLYETVARNHSGITLDTVERQVRYCLAKIDYSTPLAQKLFNLKEGASKVTNKEGLHAMLYELKQRLK